MAPIDFAEWLLKTKVTAVESANIEIQPNPNPIYTDLVFWVTVAEEEKGKLKPKSKIDRANKDVKEGNNRILLHIEFQGESSNRPMRFRVLDYVAGFADKERGIKIHSVVFYVGEKTNITDTGHHQVMGIDNRVTLAWQYDIIRLWHLDPMALLAENRPALLPLLGQAKLERPDEIMPQIYQAIKSVSDKEMQHRYRLLIELLTLLQDQEIIKMIETMMEQDEWVLDTPYLRRWREQVEDARAEAINEGIQEKYETQRQNILHMVVVRYDPSVTQHLRLKDILATITEDKKFTEICEAIISIEEFQQFYKAVEEIATAEHISLMAFA